MRCLVAVLVLAVAASAMTDAQQWGMFKARYGKKYNTNGEEATRFKIFQSNLAKAREMSAKDTATYGVTKFSDLSSEEFIAMYTGLNASAHASFLSSLPKHVPTSNKLGADWVAKGLVAPVKNQGDCGSCWAFSATAGLEGCYAVKNNKAISLSDQQMVDCCTAGYSDGCNGGWHDSCVEWAITKDWAKEAIYPYKGYQTTCRTPVKPEQIGLKANTCTYYSNEPTEEGMSEALTHAVVPVALDATALQSYVGGVIKSNCMMSSRNHAVVLVADTNDAYTVRNSWGADWGEKGYFRTVKGTDCLGIADRTCVAY